MASVCRACPPCRRTVNLRASVDTEGQESAGKIQSRVDGCQSLKMGDKISGYYVYYLVRVNNFCLSIQDRDLVTSQGTWRFEVELVKRVTHRSK